MRNQLAHITLAALIGCPGLAQAQQRPFPEPGMIAPADAPATTTIAGKGEPGETLIVDGTVTGPNRNAPIKGASVYVYHTDASGHYEPNETDPSGNPRLKGYMRTDARGRYRYTTIRPAAYPNRAIPAHVHYVVFLPGYVGRGLELQFTDDRLMTDQIRGEAAKPDSDLKLCTPRKDGRGSWHCVQDVVLKPR